MTSSADWNLNSSTSPPANLSTTSPISTSWAPEIPNRELVKLSLLYISPLNIALCLIIFLLNSLLLPHFLRNSSTSTRIFRAISLSDIVTALGNMVISLTVMLYFWGPSLNNSSQLLLYGTLVSRTLWVSSYGASVFLNVVLASLRTVVVVFPFHGRVMRIRLLARIVISYLVIMGILCACDIAGCINAVVRVYGRWDDGALEMLALHLGSPYPGAFVEFLFPARIWDVYDNLLRYVNIIILIVVYIVPVIIVFVCMVVLLVSLRHASSSRSSTTVILLSLVFVLCNSIMSICSLWTLLSRGGSISLKNMKYMCPLEGIVDFTLPLLSATLFPVIMLVRGSEARANTLLILNRIRHVVCCCQPEVITDHNGIILNND